MAEEYNSRVIAVWCTSDIAFWKDCIERIMQDRVNF